jgi:crossover junction endodeoxyribonuclease RuvC
MVSRILGLAEIPKPADAADALALAICHAWRTGVAGGGAGAGGAAEGSGALTPAQKAWRAAERAASVSAVPRSLKR